MSSKNVAASSTSSVLLVEPTTVYFPPPHQNRAIRNTINLSNASNEFVVFKVRSSNPERFVVKPTAGFATPSSITRLFITLKKNNEDLSLKKDRFRITAKKVKGTPSSKDEARKVFDASDVVVLDTDMWCSYDTNVPSNAILQFLTGDEASEIGAATPAASYTRASREDLSSVASPSTDHRPLTATTRGVSFGTRDSASLHNDSTGEAKSVHDALTNAQRVKDSIQADIVSLKAKEKELKENISAGNAKSDKMSREALELEELRTKVKLTRDALARKNDAVGIAEAGAQRAAGDAKSQGLSAADAAAAAAGLKGVPPQSTASNGTTSPTSERPAPDATPPASGMYLSTVLLWMITAYMVGMAYRVYVHNTSTTAGGDSLGMSLLPPEAREAMRSILSYVKPKLF
jgi:hypothetical protein